MTNNESMNRPTNTAEQAESYAEIMHALYGDYVNLYFIDPISFTFEAHHQRDIFKKLRLYMPAGLSALHGEIEQPCR